MLFSPQILVITPIKRSGLLDGSESDGTQLLSGNAGMTSFWTTGNTTFTNATTTAPDGSGAGSTLAEDTNNTRHILYQQPGTINTTATRHLSIYAKINGRRYLQLALCSTAVGANKALVYFDLQSFVVSDTRLTGTASSITNTAITAAVNGFYKCEFDCVLNGSASESPFFQMSLSDVATYGAPLSSDSPQYTGDGASGSFVWRPKLT